MHRRGLVGSRLRLPRSSGLTIALCVRQPRAVGRHHRCAGFVGLLMMPLFPRMRARNQSRVSASDLVEGRDHQQRQQRRGDDAADHRDCRAGRGSRRPRRCPSPPGSCRRSARRWSSGSAAGGRGRPRSSASRRSMPASSAHLAKSISRIAFLATMPISRITPIMLMMFERRARDQQSASITPISDSGSDSMIASGSRNEPNCTTRTKYISMHRDARARADLREDLGLVLAPRRPG